MTIELGALTFATVKSVADLMNWADHFASLAPRRFAFRGQPQEFMTLAPSFSRHFGQSSHGAAELIEQELMSAFRDHYANLPDRSSDMPAPSAIGGYFDLRCLSVMQHYEVPTRLLDWTSDFWTAIYFACGSDPSNNAEVWLYDRQIFSKQLEENPSFASLLTAASNPPPEPSLLKRRGEQFIAELDPGLTPRMRKQLAHHTVSADVFSEHADLLDRLAKAAGEVQDPWYFRRFVIDRNCKSNVLRYLADHRHITASTIFPDVVGLGRFLRWQLDSLKTMLL